MAIRQKTLHYRRAVLLDDGYTLQERLQQLLSKFPFVDDRWEGIGPEEKIKRLINHHFHDMGMEFGNFLSFESGTNRMLMTVENRVKAIPV